VEENDSKIEFFDDKNKEVDLDIELIKLKEDLSTSEQQSNTFGNFAKLLDTKVNSGLMSGYTSRPLNSEESRKDMQILLLALVHGNTY